MRKIDIVAHEKFNGDISKALDYLIHEPGVDFNIYVDELTRDEARMILDFLERDAIKHYGSEENYYDEIKKQGILEQLDLSEEEVKNATKNPYKAKMLKNALKMLIMEGGIISLGIVGGTFGITPEVFTLAGSVATGLFSMTLASNIIEYVKFKKVKKIIDAQNQDVSFENNTRGRGM